MQLTLFVVAAAVAVLSPAAVPQANALSNMGPPPAKRFVERPPGFGTHRMIKRRGPASHRQFLKRQEDEPVIPIINPTATNEDPAAPPSSTAQTSTPIPPTTTRQQPPVTTSQPPVTSERTTSANTSVQTTANTASDPATTTTRQTQTSQQAASQTATSEEDVASTATGTRRVTAQSTRVIVETQSSTPTSKAQDENASFLPKPVLIGLTVAAASCVVAAALWTVIRKWKFGASRKFEERLEPVNWELEKEKATNDRLADHDPSAVQVHRGGSVSSHSGNNAGYGSNGYGAGGGGGVSMAPDLPPHDFTAGPTNSNNNLAPNAYGDMYRGPSPAPSMNYGTQYDNGYNNNGYGNNTNYGNNNAYGGYDAYDYNNGYGGANDNNNNPVPRHQF